jgi:hypothetical protein
VRWLPLDITCVVTRGEKWVQPDLSKVDEVGFADLNPAVGERRSHRGLRSAGQVMITIGHRDVFRIRLHTDNRTKSVHDSAVPREVLDQPSGLLWTTPDAAYTSAWTYCYEVPLWMLTLE